MLASPVENVRLLYNVDIFTTLRGLQLKPEERVGGVYGWAAVCFMFTKRERKHVHIFLAAVWIIALLCRKLLLMMLKIN